MGTLAAAAAGGTPRPRPDQTWRTPPPAVVSPGGMAGTFRGRYVVVYGTGQNTGVFVYSGTPALGNLIASIAATGGTDPYGNPYGTGIETYLSSTQHVQMTGANLLFLNGDNLPGQITEAGAGLTSIQSGLKAITDTRAQIELRALNGTTQVVVVAGSAVSPQTSALLEVQGTAAVNVVNAIVAGAAETWHPMTLVNGFTNVTGFAPASYRLNALGNVELAGRITGTISGSTQFGSLPTGYYSTTYSRAYAANVDASAGITPSETPHIRCYTTGALNATGLANGTATVDLDGTFMLSRG